MSSPEVRSLQCPPPTKSSIQKAGKMVNNPSCRSWCSCKHVRLCWHGPSSVISHFREGCGACPAMFGWSALLSHCRRIRWLRSTNISARLVQHSLFRFTNFITHKYYTLITTIWSYTLRPLTILTKLAFVTTFYNFGPETVPTYFHHAIHTIMLLTYLAWIQII
jgi:hypothetical protein